MPQNQQVGHQLATENVPQFAHYTVRGGTWKEKDPLQVQRNMNGDESLFNLTGWDPGVDATCDLWPDAGFTLRKLDVLPEIGVDNPRTFTVEDSGEKTGFGPRGICFTGVKLVLRDALDPTQVS